MHLLRLPAVILLARLATGGILLVAALAKIGDPLSFALQMHNFHLLPVELDNGMSVVLPWIELLTALSLILALRPRAGAVVALAMMIVFLIAVSSALARHLNFDCGCFGKGLPTKIGAQKLAENIGFVVLALLGAQRMAPRPARSVEAAPAPQPAETVSRA